MSSSSSFPELLLSLPDDVISLISSHLSPSDLLALSLSSRRLLLSDKPWWEPQCLRLHPSRASPSPLPSYFHLCRFLLSLRPLLGLWVHQNPELGNLVHVSWSPSPSPLSLLACRVIPQELSPRLLWAPVFEILPDPTHAAGPPLLFLHGIDNHLDHIYPGSIASIKPSSNVLLLEADSGSCSKDDSNFSRLAFGDRRRLLDLIAGKVRQQLTPDLDSVPLFPMGPDELILAENRKLQLIEMHSNSGGGRVDWRAAGIHDDNGTSNGKKRSLFSVVKQIIGRTSRLTNSPTETAGAVVSGNGGDSKHVALSEFLKKGGDTVGLSLRATSMRLTTYRAWPNMHDNRFALYKLPCQEPLPGKEYAGLWGGTFGWPPGKTSADKPGKALFFLLLSYEEVDGNMLLIATKILEGTHYVLHPNGSAMFIVKVDEPALEGFPWETYGDDGRVEVKRNYAGEGIANGYGFRYPGSKPGSLFEMQNGHLSFVWKESKAVLTLQRLDLEDMLRKGEQVPPLPPIANFAYLTKSYSNVFAGFPSNSGCSSSPRGEISPCLNLYH